MTSASSLCINRESTYATLVIDDDPFT